MNDNQSSHTVPLRLFAQNLVQRLEQLNNVDQFTDSSNLALPFALFQLCQINLSVTTSIEAVTLLGGRCGRAASSATHPSGKETPQRPHSD
jgi:hypothetical protein